MKTQSNVKPLKKYQIEDREDSKVAILFFDNITEHQKDKQKVYNYDMYTFITDKQDNLEDRIKNNYDTWLEYAKKQEVDKLSTDVRAKRDELLSATDWTQMQDTALSEDKQLEYQKYRQELRDLTKQDGFPYEVVFPQAPNK